jgi:hypothetical protein
MTQLDPIINQPLLYVNGLLLSNNATTPNTKLDVAAGICRDSNNQIDMNLGNYLGLSGVGTANSSTVINFGVNGINGLDTGSIAASTFYYILVIADSSNKNPTGAIASLSATAPTLPFGYDSIRLIGCCKTDGSSHILLYYTSGSGSAKFFQWDAPITVTVTSSGTSATYSAMDLSTGVPVSNYGTATVYYIWDPNAAGDILNFTPAGATGDYIVNTAITTAIQDGNFVIKPLTVSSAPKVSYKISAGTLTGVKVMGFNFNL